MDIDSIGRKKVSLGSRNKFCLLGIGSLFDIHFHAPADERTDENRGYRWAENHGLRIPLCLTNSICAKGMENSLAVGWSL